MSELTKLLLWILRRPDRIERDGAWSRTWREVKEDSCRQADLVDRMLVPSVLRRFNQCRAFRREVACDSKKPLPGQASEASPLFSLNNLSSVTNHHQVPKAGNGSDQYPDLLRLKEVARRSGVSFCIHDLRRDKVSALITETRQYRMRSRAGSAGKSA